jgi:hypothetical protein
MVQSIHKDKWEYMPSQPTICENGIFSTFNNISVISWQSVLLVEEIREPEENHRPVASHWQTVSHNIVYLALTEIRTHNISGDRH